MKARIKWVEDRTFTGESQTGHVIPFGASVGAGGTKLCPSPMELVLIGTGGCSAFGGGGSSTPYCVTKAGLVNLTQELARGLAPEVRVNAIAPGLVESDWQCRWDEDWRAQSIARTPLERPGEPGDYAEVILFLCAGAAYVTGQTISVDGGLRS